MGVICQILINKPKGDMHKAGETVTGIVKYIVDEPTEYKDVTLFFLGKGECHWSESGKDTTNHYNNKEDYIVICIDLHKKSQEIITLHGEYQYPFDFFLPEDIPRSYKDYTGSITYTIELKFVKPNLFSSNKVFTTEVPVFNYVTPNSEGPVIFGLNKKLMSLFKKSSVVNLKAEINKTCYAPGENIQITYKVDNSTDVKINSVKTELYCYMIYTADCGHKNIDPDKIKGCEVNTMSVAERSMFEHSCILPTIPELYSIVNSKVINKEYRVKVTVKLPMPHRNAIVEMPVVIGEQRGTADPPTESVEEDEAPPSYWEVMCEEGKEGKK